MVPAAADTVTVVVPAATPFIVTVLEDIEAVAVPVAADDTVNAPSPLYVIATVAEFPTTTDTLAGLALSVGVALFIVKV